METVHILATVRKPELLDAATLVFRTLRTGFPEARVCVHGNGLDPRSAMAVNDEAYAWRAGFINYAETSHDAWIEGLIEREVEPFWICDTDVVFWSRVPSAVAGRPLFLGQFEPEFDEEWTGTRHMERLHTALMWINPVALRMGMREWMGKIPRPWGITAQFPLVRQHFVALKGELTRFYDTMAGLWHAGMGTRFTEEQEACFDHLHCATYADLVSDGTTSLKDLRSAHQAVYKDLHLARGIRKWQRLYYESRSPRRTKGTTVCTHQE